MSSRKPRSAPSSALRLYNHLHALEFRAGTLSVPIKVPGYSPKTIKEAIDLGLVEVNTSGTRIRAMPLDRVARAVLDSDPLWETAQKHPTKRKE
jgi:hypothetical protein